MAAASEQTCPSTDHIKGNPRKRLVWRADSWRREDGGTPGHACVFVRLFVFSTLDLSARIYLFHPYFPPLPWMRPGVQTSSTVLSCPSGMISSYPSLLCILSTKGWFYYFRYTFKVQLERSLVRQNRPIAFRSPCIPFFLFYSINNFSHVFFFLHGCEVFQNRQPVTHMSTSQGGTHKVLREHLQNKTLKDHSVFKGKEAS